MKNSALIRRIFCALLVLVLIVVPVTATEAEIDLSVTQGSRTLDGMVPILRDSEDFAEARSALLYDIGSDTIIFGKNMDEPLNPAGLVKIMTGLVVAEKCAMDEQVTITQEVLDLLNSSNRSLDFQDGEIIPMGDLMYAVLVEAAHEAAVIAAVHAFGSLEACLEEMNRYAEELGCTNTHFANVHGLHDDSQVSTARDMAKILSTAIKNEAFWEPFSTYVVRIPATNLGPERKLSSGSFVFNQNLGSNHFDKRVSGSRTGTTINGERSIALTAEVGDVQLISIVMGSVSEINPDGSTGFYKEARTLMDIGFNEYTKIQVLHENEVLDQFPVKDGNSYVSVCVKDSVITSLPLDCSANDLIYRYAQNDAEIQAPVKADTELGMVSVWYNNTCLANTKMYAMHNVDTENVVDTQIAEEEKETSAVTLLMIVGVIVGLLLILLFGRRLIFRMIHKRQIRRLKAERRRRR